MEWGTQSQKTSLSKSYVRKLLRILLIYIEYCSVVTYIFSDPPSAIAERAEVLGGDDCYVELVCNAYGNLVLCQNK